MTEILITGLHHDLSKKRSFVYFVWKSDPGETSGFGCALSIHSGGFAGRSEKGAEGSFRRTRVGHSCNALVTMCNLYSITTNQAAIAGLFRVVNRYADRHARGRQKRISQDLVPIAHQSG
jgi:hypothetical protein